MFFRAVSISKVLPQVILSYSFVRMNIQEISRVERSTHRPIATTTTTTTTTTATANELAETNKELGMEVVEEDSAVGTEVGSGM